MAFAACNCKPNKSRGALQNAARFRGALVRDEQLAGSLSAKVDSTKKEAGAGGAASDGVGVDY